MRIFEKMYKLFPVFGKQSPEDVRRGAMVRGLYCFRLDGKWEYRCPIKIERTMRELCPNMDLELQRVQSAELLKKSEDVQQTFRDQTNLEAAESMARIVAAAREAFKIPPLISDGKGMGESEIINVFVDFSEYIKEMEAEKAPFA